MKNHKFSNFLKNFPINQDLIKEMTISINYRALFTWFSTVVFLILLCLRLEGKINWNYFLIFIPFWIYDLILIVWVILELIKRHQHYRVIDSFKK